MSPVRPVILIRGGGDLASGTAVRLHHSGFNVLVTELPQPLALRRLVSFAEVVYAGEVVIEGISGKRCENLEQAASSWEAGSIPVVVDPEGAIREKHKFPAIVDGRMLKSDVQEDPVFREMTIGLGPGFEVGINCCAVVETQRGHTLGRVIRQGRALEDSGIPEIVSGHDVDRVLRAPSEGQMKSEVKLGSIVRRGEVIASVDGEPLLAPFDGALRGLIHDGLKVHRGMKVGDLDPRMEPAYCSLVSDKAFAVGGGVLEALLSIPEIRPRLGN